MIRQTQLGSGLRTIGWWTPQRDQVDPTIPYLPLEDPVASDVTGTGAMLSAVSTLAGVGLSISTGTGAFLSQASTLLGSGLSTSTGTGELTAQLAALAGSGVSVSTGTGILLVSVAVLAGIGLVEDALSDSYTWYYNYRRSRTHDAIAKKKAKCKRLRRC